ncbi:hypothetical protein BaRGS_00001069 [Batillaria attramentaria]|uniref:Methyltransferase-like protein 22 n=1 Tax=Batillaria attramentaria TaxID=370345 RepID=A0ABD0M5W0_9CAEN
MERNAGKVLSDVHMLLQGETASVCGSELTVSRFFFQIPKPLEKHFLGQPVGGECRQADQTTFTDTSTLTQSPSAQRACLKNADDVSQETCGEFDQDGDLVLQRPPPAVMDKRAVVTIVHAMATDLEDVGQQVWLGALLLCDFLLHTTGLMEGAVVLDLGADHGDGILRLAQQNFHSNGSLPLKAKFCVRELNWMAEDPLSIDHHGQAENEESFRLTATDLKTLQQCEVLLAAEVVYDQDLTDAFFRILYAILAAPPAKVVYMTVEKRQVFTTSALDIVSPAYTHFRENLADLSSVDEGPVRFVCSQVDTSFPQYFQYQRTKELELWKIETLFPNG